VNKGIGKLLDRQSVFYRGQNYVFVYSVAIEVLGIEHV